MVSRYAEYQVTVGIDVARCPPRTVDTGWWAAFAWGPFCAQKGSLGHLPLPSPFPFLQFTAHSPHRTQNTTHIGIGLRHSPFPSAIWGLSALLALAHPWFVS